MNLDQQSADLRNQIRELQAKESKLRKQKYEENKEEFQSLEWLKGASLWFQENPYGPYGQTEYVLRGGKAPSLLKEIWGEDTYSCHTVFGDDKDYMKNVLVRRPMGDSTFCDYELYTSNADTFVKFLDAVDVTVHIPGNSKDKLKVYSLLVEIGK